MGTAPITVQNTGTLTYNNTASDFTLANAITIQSGGNVTSRRSSGTLTLSGQLTLPTSGTAIFNLDDQPTGTINATFATNTVGLLGGLTIQEGTNNATVGQVNLNHVISGGFGLTKTGTGNLRLSGTSTYTGDTTILNGTIFVTGNIAISTNSNLGNSANAIIIGDTSGTNGAGLFTDGTLTIGRAINIRFGSSGVKRIGIVGNFAATVSGPVTLNDHVTFQVNQNTLTVSSLLADSGGARNVTKTQVGTLVLSGANTYSGKTSILDGTLSASSLNNIGTPVASSSLGRPTTVANGTIDLGSTTTTGVLIYTGGATTTDRVINLAGTTGGGTIDQSGTGALVFSSDLTATGAGSKTLTLQGSNANTGTLQGAIVNSTGTTALTKAGTGTWILSSNTSNYSGVTNVNAGTLRTTQANALGSATGGTNVVSGAVLELNGNFTLPAEAILLSGTGLAGAGALLATGNVTAPGRVGTIGSVNIGATMGNTLTLNGTFHKESRGDLTYVGGGNIVANSAIGDGDYTLSTLTGRLYLSTTPDLTTNVGILSVVSGAPSNTANLTGNLSFASDTAFTTFFGGTNPGTANFTASFDGILTVVTGGTYSLAATNNDDGAAVWLDRDQDGVFETAGDDGNERLQGLVGIGNTAVATVNLDPGNYRVVYAVRDTASGSSLTGRIQGPIAVGQTNGTTLAIVNPSLTTSGANNVVVNSTGTVTFGAANAYGGTTTVNNGTLLLSGATATLGSSAAGTAVETGATLALQGGVIVASESIRLNGVGAPSQLGALVNVSGDNSIAASSPIAARAANLGEIRIASLADSLTIDSTIDLQSSKLSVDGAGNTIVNGIVSGVGATIGTPPTSGVSGVFTDVPEASGYTLALEHNNIPVSVNGALAFPYTLDNTSSIGAFDRIAYYVELQGGSEAPTREFVYASMDAFTSNIGQIGVPTGVTKWAFQRFVTNMNVYSNVPVGSGGGQITPGTAISTGNIEIWPSNYSGGNTLPVPNASSAAGNAGFDFGDGGFNTTDGHGSFQIHNYDVDGAGPGTAGQTILAYNQWRQSNPGLGIGNSPVGATSGFDYTMVTNRNSYTTLRRLAVLVREVTPGYRQADNSIVKLGSGTLTLANDNTYNGGTTVNAGTLLVNDPATAGSGTGTGSVTINTGGTVAGTGSIAGAVTGAAAAPSSTLGVGSPITAIETLETGALSLNANSIYAVDLNGVATPVAGTHYDQTIVTGTVALGTATLLDHPILNITLTGTITPGTLQTFVIISNDGIDAVTGLFRNAAGTLDLPEGSAVTVSGSTLYISYAGGDGNDVVLSSQPLMQGTALADTFTVTGNGTTFTVTRTNANGTVTATYVSPVSPLNIVGGDGDDIAIVRYSAASTDPIPSGGIVYDGGTETNDPVVTPPQAAFVPPQTFGDVLVVEDTRVDHSLSTTYTPSATIFGSGVVSVDGAMGGTITFSELEPVDISGMAVATLATPAANGNDALIVTNGLDSMTAMIPALVVTGTTGLAPTNIESGHFFNNDLLVINTIANDGNDTVTITSASNAHANDRLKIETGAGTDSVTINGDATFTGDALAATADIEIDSQSIILNGGTLTVTAANGSVDLNAGGGAITSPGTATPDDFDVVANALVAAATTGIGATGAPLLTNVASLSADNTGMNNVVVTNTLATATTATSLSTGTGNVIFQQLGGGPLTVQTATTTNGNIDLTVTGAALSAGTTSVSAGGMNNVQLTTLTSGNVTVGAVAAANTVFVDSAGTILDDGSNTTLIVASTADLDAAGDIGASVNQIDTTVMFLTALATGGSIFVDETDGLTVTSATATGGSNDITIRSLAATLGNILVGTITAPDVVTLAALNGSILEDTADTATDIAASDAQLSATGSIGASTAGGDLDTALATLTAGSTTAGGIYLTDTDGLTVTSATTTAGDIYLDAARAAAGNLTATLVTAAGTGADVRLRTLTAGSDILLGDVTATDKVAVHALGLISDNLAGEVNPAANANVTATSLVLISTGGVGNADDIDTAVTYLAAAGGTGDVRVTNSGPLTITSAKAAPAGVEFTALPGIPDTTGVTGNGTGEITALSPLTVAANMIMGGSVTQTASDDAAAGDILTVNSGITVQSTQQHGHAQRGRWRQPDWQPGCFRHRWVYRRLDQRRQHWRLGGRLRLVQHPGWHDPDLGAHRGEPHHHHRRQRLGDSFTQTGSITASGTGDITISLGAGNDQYDAASTATAVLTALGNTITINGNNGDDMILLGDQFFAATISATDTFLNGNDATNAPDGSDTFKVRASSTTSFRIDGDDPTTPIPGDTLWVDLTGVTGPVNEEHGDPTTTISFPPPNTQKHIIYQEIENRQTTGSTGTPLVNHIFDLLDYPLVTDGVFDVQLTNPSNLEVALNGVIVYTGDDDTVNSLTFGGKDGSNDAVRIHASATGELPSEGGVVGFGLDGVGTLPGVMPAGIYPAGTTRKSVSTAFTANSRTSAGLLSGAPADDRAGLYFDGRGGTNSIVLDVTTARDVAYLSDNQTGFGVGQGDLSVNSSLLSPTLRGFAATFANVNSVHLREMTASGSKLLIDASSTPLTTAISVVDIADPTTTAQYDALNPVNNTTAPLGGGASITFVGASQLVGTVPAPLTNPNVLPTRFAGFADVTIRSGGFVAPATAATGGETLDLISIDATGLIALTLDTDSAITVGAGTDPGAADTIRLRSLPLGVTATLLGGLGSDTFRLHGETTVVVDSGPATDYTNVAGGDALEQNDTVNNILGPVTVMGEDGNVANNTDQLVVFDGGDLMGDDIFLNAVNPNGSQNYRIAGITGFGAPGAADDDITFLGIDTLILTATSGNDDLDARFVDTDTVLPATVDHDLNAVTLNGWINTEGDTDGNDDDFLLFISDQRGGSGSDGIGSYAGGGSASGVTSVTLNGDYVGTLNGLAVTNPNASDGFDTFGENPPGYVSPNVAPPAGTPVADTVRMLRPSTTTAITVNGGRPTGPALPTGDTLGDIINIDVSAMPTGKAVVWGTLATGYTSLFSFNEVAAFSYIEIEDTNLVDNGILTNFQQGDYFARGTTGNDVIQFQANASNPNAAVAKVNAYQAVYLIPGKTLVYGGAGNDTIAQSVFAHPAEFYGQDGTDNISGGPAADKLVGGTGNDSINANNGNDIIWGDNDPVAVGLEDTEANRSILASDTAGPGASPASQYHLLNVSYQDIISAGNGDDTVYAGPGNDGATSPISLGAGSDWFYGGVGNDIAAGGLDNDRLYGGVGNDRLTGDEGQDVLAGNDGDDEMYGKAGNDVLIGGAGNDYLSGDDGNDLLFDGGLLYGGGSDNSTDRTFAPGGDANDQAMIALLSDWSDGMLDNPFTNDHNGTDQLRGGADNDTFSDDNTDPNDILDFGFGTDTDLAN